MRGWFSPTYCIKVGYTLASEGTSCPHTALRWDADLLEGLALRQPLDYMQAACKGFRVEGKPILDIMPLMRSLMSGGGVGSAAARGCVFKRGTGSRVLRFALISDARFNVGVQGVTWGESLPPILLLHGTADTCALVSNATQFKEALEEAGAKVGHPTKKWIILQV
jgi:acetyl esterase/lipase